MMQQRTLGTNGLAVTALGMGIMNVVHAYGPPIERAAAVKLVQHAYERGIRFFDTAGVYGRFATRKNVTPAQIALAWLLAQNPWIVPISGINTPQHVDENLASVDLVLAPDDLRDIATAASQITVQGERLSAGRLSLSEA